MSAIGPGDWVECVYVGHWLREQPGVWVEGVRLGALYCVEAVSVDPLDGLGLLRLARVKADTTTGWYGVDRFRPIYRPKAELIESLKAPPARTKEHA